MQTFSPALEASLDAFADEWRASTGAFAAPGDVPTAATTMTDEGVLRSAASLADLQRSVDVYRVAIAGELAARSDSVRGAEGIARRAGHSRPAHHLAELWGITVGEAWRLCEVGLAVRPRLALDGTPLPARYPEAQRAIGEGALGVDAAAVIVRELNAASPRCSIDALRDAEQQLVELAPGFTVGEVRVLARQTRDRLDQDGPQPAETLRQARRSLRLSSRHDGMLHLEWDMTPQTGGLVKAAIDAIVGRELHQAREDAHLLGDDPRTLEQLRADAAEQVFRHTATCSSAGGDLPSITMVVRMTMDSLLTGLGTAEIDGIGETISASDARRMAGEAGIVPIVLGGSSEVLDYGKARRLFSTAQKIALAERDGGCAWGGCECPPSYTEAHHIEWWSTAPNTDLSNGVLLCSFHHHRIHDDGWEIRFVDQTPYFIPPPWVDWRRTPHRGGRVALPQAA
jgi:hypothetical protein